MNSTRVERRPLASLPRGHPNDERGWAVPTIAVKESRGLRPDRRTLAMMFLPPFLPASVIGRALRVPDGDVAPVRAVLDAGGVPAALDVVPATFEETFVRLALAGRNPVPPARERTPQ
jgi:hypothetical protein